MPLTKAQSETLIRSLVDDPDSVRWSATELPLYVDLSYDSLWGRLLQDRPRYNSQLDNVAALTSPGYVDLTTGGDLTQRFYGLTKVTRGGRVYSKADMRSVVLEDGEVVVADDYTWMFVGTDELHLFPYDTTTDVEVRYAYRPAAWSSLASGDTVTWPEGHEWAFVMYAAAMLMAKGAAEDASELYGIAELEYSRMLSSISTRDGEPVTMYVPDSNVSWGSD